MPGLILNALKNITKPANTIQDF